jgi:hypothetical protein
VPPVAKNRSQVGESFNGMDGPLMQRVAKVAIVRGFSSKIFLPQVPKRPDHSGWIWVSQYTTDVWPIDGMSTLGGLILQVIEVSRDHKR